MIPATPPLFTYHFSLPLQQNNPSIPSISSCRIVQTNANAGKIGYLAQI
jgi:hypothetical protein